MIDAKLIAKKLDLAARTEHAHGFFNVALHHVEKIQRDAHAVGYARGINEETDYDKGVREGLAMAAKECLKYKRAEVARTAILALIEATGERRVGEDPKKP